MIGRFPGEPVRPPSSFIAGATPLGALSRRHVARSRQVLRLMKRTAFLLVFLALTGCSSANERPGPPTTATRVAHTTMTMPSPATKLKQSKALIYSTEIGAWRTDGEPAVSEPISTEVREAKVRAIRFASLDCFTDMTCGSDNHAGSLSRSDFDNAIQGITNPAALNAIPLIKMAPIAKDTINGVDGSTFCPPWTGDASGNLPFYREVLSQVRAVYAGPIIIESSNEMEFACVRVWQRQGARIGSAGSIGVSRRIGEHFAATMPALKQHARNLGFSEVVVMGYIGNGGGPNWSSNYAKFCSPVDPPDRTRHPYDFECRFNPRWVDEFNNAVKSAYDNAPEAAKPDYIPDAISIHAFPHGPDFEPGPGEPGYDNYSFDDRIVYAYYNNWNKQARARLNAIWGSSIGSQVLLAISEWNAGVSRSGTDHWIGWNDPVMIQSFYAGWFDMLQGNGVTTGSGTRFWQATNFCLACNSDFAGPNPNWPGKYNLVNRNGTPNPQYAAFKDANSTDAYN